MSDYQKRQFEMAADAIYINLIATLKGWDAQIITPGIIWTQTYRGNVTDQGEVYATVKAESHRKVMKLARKSQKEVRAYFLRKANEGEVSGSQSGGRVPSIRDLSRGRGTDRSVGGVSKQAPNG